MRVNRIIWSVELDLKRESWLAGEVLLSGDVEMDLQHTLLDQADSVGMVCPHQKQVELFYYVVSLFWNEGSHLQSRCVDFGLSGFCLVQ